MIDLCDKELTRKVFLENKFDAVIHFAALKSVPESVENPLLYYRNNLDSLLNLLELSAEFAIKNFVFLRLVLFMETLRNFPLPRKLLLEMQNLLMRVANK